MDERTIVDFPTDPSWADKINIGKSQRVVAIYALKVYHVVARHLSQKDQEWFFQEVKRLIREAKWNPTERPYALTLVEFLDRQRKRDSQK